MKLYIPCTDRIGDRIQQFGALVSGDIDIFIERYGHGSTAGKVQTVIHGAFTIGMVQSHADESCNNNYCRHNIEKLCLLYKREYLSLFLFSIVFLTGKAQSIKCVDNKMGHNKGCKHGQYNT